VLLVNIDGFGAGAVPKNEKAVLGVGLVATGAVGLTTGAGVAGGEETVLATVIVGFASVPVGVLKNEKIGAGLAVGFGA
jgi:hypothetical protein